MERRDVREIHYITHVDNLPGIHQLGILSHDLAQGRPHVSLAHPGVQSRRSGIVVPGGRRLHGYANLYLNARNGMMYKIVMNNLPQDVAVVVVDPASPDSHAGRADDDEPRLPDVFDIHEVVIATQNAASQPLWLPSPDGLAGIEIADIRRRDWNHADPRVKERQSQSLQAEVLVPDVLDPAYIRCVYVTGQSARNLLIQRGLPIPVEINPDVFFNHGPR